MNTKRQADNINKIKKTITKDRRKISIFSTFFLMQDQGNKSNRTQIDRETELTKENVQIQKDRQTLFF